MKACYNRKRTARNITGAQSQDQNKILRGQGERSREREGRVKAGVKVKRLSVRCEGR